MIGIFDVGLFIVQSMVRDSWLQGIHCSCSHTHCFSEFVASEPIFGDRGHQWKSDVHYYFLWLLSHCIATTTMQQTVIVNSEAITDNS